MFRALRSVTPKRFARLKFSAALDEFSHLIPMTARLNHGSFGAAPKSVLERQNELRNAWHSNADAFYFSGALEEQLRLATAAAARAVGAPPERTVLVENASVAASIVANRWAWSCVQARGGEGVGVQGVRSRDGHCVVLVLSWRYGAVENILRATVGRAGGQVVRCELPFPLTSEEQVLRALDHSLRAHCPRFVMLDHVSSQPSLALPIESMVALCRSYGCVAEVAVDAAHAVGSVDLTPVDSAAVSESDCRKGASAERNGGDASMQSSSAPSSPPSPVMVGTAGCLSAGCGGVGALGADWWFSNLHKWAFAPPTACVFVAGATDFDLKEGTSSSSLPSSPSPPSSSSLLRTTEHVVPSWGWPGGLEVGALWTGTRDYSAFLAVPRALEFMHSWSPPLNQESAPIEAKRGEQADGSVGSRGGVSGSRGGSSGGGGSRGGGLLTASHNRAQLLKHMEMLQEAWDTEPMQPDSTVASMGMVRLPRGLTVTDVPGVPGCGVRATLRGRYGIEAAIGTFPTAESQSTHASGGGGEETMGCVRLSHAVYNTPAEFEALRDAVLEMAREEKS